jgi:hypothetical protein
MLACLPEQVGSRNISPIQLKYNDIYKIFLCALGHITLSVFQ